MALTQDKFLPKGWVSIAAHFLSAVEAQALQLRLREQLLWTQRPIQMFGREVMQPRLVAFYADRGVAYQYSGLRWVGEGWPEALLSIKQQIQQASGCAFNSVLCNAYRDGNDSMGWHADDERELGTNPTIASLSLGGERKFMLKPKNPAHGARVTYRLQSGSLMIMAGDLQHHWLHQVPKTKQAVAERINLTFRWIDPR